MKRYCITLGNFETKDEARRFIGQLVRNYSTVWTPGEPIIFSDDCSIEEFESPR